MPDRRHLAHRIDRKIVGAALLARLHVQYMQLVLRAQFFEKDEGAERTGVRRMEKRDLTICGHTAPPC